jgi:hypothetical protein
MASIGLAMVLSYIAGAVASATWGPARPAHAAASALTPGQVSVIQTVNWLLIGQDVPELGFLPFVRK